ncbi:hypothetical protein NLK61_24880 [Pseudomonas fuscovaginae UPB0736]|uniref:hypothetical protein n=1 Tax=Pseudomonas asplenii TaxID=53407 RepID=UPI00028A2A71|nr:hypothetical protein [Pseudomonas fuscovaginae]UUQ64413.1 hypothetical protein NLK61_24880 [Pseudomonas fuscovaginae UPB0736]
MMPNKGFLKIALTGFIVSLMAGCGSIASSMATDSDLQQKAGVALNTSPDQLKILDRSTSLDSVKFRVQNSKGIYNCYYTSVYGAIDSDTMCSGPVDGAKAQDSKTTSTKCNALTKAAGRC